VGGGGGRGTGERQVVGKTGDAGGGEARFGDQAREGGTKVNLFPGNAKSLGGGKMFSAALFVLIDCQFARCPHLSGDGGCASERAIRAHPEM